jgi:hypothetical protein
MVVGKAPVIIMFSDQNFVPTLSCAYEKCINIVRLENATLIELFEIAMEIFENVSFPDGSIFMFGISSYLAGAGTSVYARDWTEVVAWNLSLSFDSLNSIKMSGFHY